RRESASQVRTMVRVWMIDSFSFLLSFGRFLGKALLPYNYTTIPQHCGRYRSAAAGARRSQSI
ncbi:MAG TPA: hypothetical protein VKY74_11985, partial [Chloroflexia bacterium]|nr:hypothetical protein [Chloroflexia bacterium]